MPVIPSFVKQIKKKAENAVVHGLAEYQETKFIQDQAAAKTKDSPKTASPATPSGSTTG